MQFLNDSFTDTSGVLLSAHVGEIGATWTLHPSYTGTMQIDANRARPTTSANTAYYASGSPAGPNYSVEFPIFKLSSTGINGGCGRMSTTDNTFYHGRYGGAAHELYKFVAGVATLLGSWAETLNVSDERLDKLEMNGDQISLYVDGILRIGPITDTAITAAGKVGVRGSNTGFHLTSIRADDLGGTPIVGSEAGVGADVSSPPAAVIGKSELGSGVETASSVAMLSALEMSGHAIEVLFKIPEEGANYVLTPGNGFPASTRFYLCTKSVEEMNVTDTMASGQWTQVAGTATKILTTPVPVGGAIDFIDPLLWDETLGLPKSIVAATTPPGGGGRYLGAWNLREDGAAVDLATQGGAEGGLLVELLSYRLAHAGAL